MFVLSVSVLVSAELIFMKPSVNWHLTFHTHIRQFNTLPLDPCVNVGILLYEPLYDNIGALKSILCTELSSEADLEVYHLYFGQLGTDLSVLMKEMASFQELCPK